MKKIFIVLIPLLLISCKSTKIIEKDNSYEVIGKLETEVELMEFSNQREKFLISISIETAKNIEDELDRMEYLFNQYELITNNMIEEKDLEIERLKSIIEESKKDEK